MALELQGLRAQSLSKQTALPRILARLSEMGRNDKALETRDDWAKFEQDSAQLGALETAPCKDIEAREHLRTELRSSASALAEKCSCAVQVQLAQLKDHQDLAAELTRPAPPQFSNQPNAVLWNMLAPCKQRTLEAMQAAHDVESKMAQARRTIECASLSEETVAEDLLQQLAPLVQATADAEVAFNQALREERALVISYLDANDSVMNACLDAIEYGTKELQTQITQNSDWMEQASAKGRALSLTLEAGNRRSAAIALIESTGKALREAKVIPARSLSQETNILSFSHLTNVGNND